MATKRVTAADFLAQLESDPAYQKRLAERQEREARLEREYAAAEQPVLRALAKSGFNVASLWDYLKTHSVLPDGLATVLLEELPRVENIRVQETIVRALTNPRRPYDGRPLIRLFECTDSENLRWVIGNTMAEARPTHVSEWLLTAVQQDSYGRGREMLMLALARLAPAELAVPVLLSLFDEFPGHVAMALARCGRPSELGFLRDRLGTGVSSKPWVRKSIQRAIRAIERRSCRGRR